MKKTSRGAMLGAVLMVIAVCMIVSFSMAGTATFHIRTAASQAARQQARDYADTAVAQAAAAACAAANANTFSTFGTHGETFTLAALPPGSLSYLTFAQGGPWPASVNNPSATNCVYDSLGNTVPPGCIDLIGVGQVGTVTAQVEELIFMPPFQYVVASSGTFSSPQGGLTIARVDNPSVLADGYANVSAADILPGNMTSDSSAAAAILIGPNSFISGDVSAAGGISLSQSAIVKGAQLPYVQPAILPSVDLTQDPTAGFGQTQIVSSLTAGGTVSGFARSTQSITAPGNLALQGAVWYVEGDLHVTGALSGTGAIYTTGKVTVDGGVNMAATDLLALVAGGNVTLTGGSAGGSINNVFQGLVYTQGNLTANNLTLLGSFIANAPTSPGGTVQLGTGNTVINNSTVVGVPQFTQIMMGYTVTTGSGSTQTSSTGATGNFLMITPLAGSQPGTAAASNITVVVNPDGSATLSNPWNNQTLTIASQGGGTAGAQAMAAQAGMWTMAQYAASGSLLGLLGSPGQQALTVGDMATDQMMAMQAMMNTLAKNQTYTTTVGLSGPLTLLNPAVTSSSSALFSFDINKFIAPADRVRVLLYRPISI